MAKEFNEMNGYKLSRMWFDLAFERTDIKPVHTALFLWIVELNNRLAWKKQFGLPTISTMEMLGISSKTTYYKTLDKLTELGVVTLIERSKNQHQSTVIAVSFFTSPTGQQLDGNWTALDTALLRQLDSTVPIDKQRNKETKKPINKETTSAPLFKFISNIELSKTIGTKQFALLENTDINLPPGTFIDWLEYKKEIGAPYKSPKGIITLAVNIFEKFDPVRLKSIIDTSIQNNWKGLFPDKLKYLNNDSTNNGISTDRRKIVEAILTTNPDFNNI